MIIIKISQNPGYIGTKNMELLQLLVNLNPFPTANSWSRRHHCSELVPGSFGPATGMNMVIPSGCFMCFVSSIAFQSESSNFHAKYLTKCHHYHHSTSRFFFRAMRVWWLPALRPVSWALHTIDAQQLFGLCRAKQCLWCNLIFKYTSWMVRDACWSSVLPIRAGKCTRWFRSTFHQRKVESPPCITLTPSCCSTKHCKSRALWAMR